MYFSSSSEGPCNGPALVRSQSRGESRVRRTSWSGDARSRSPINRTPVAWNNVEAPDVAPVKLKFSPRRTPGVQPPLSSGRPTPLDIFGCFFDGEVLRLLCSNTNTNAARNKERGRRFGWWQVTPEELKKFVGLLLYMGVMEMPKMTDLWRKNHIFSVPFPSTEMSRDRFKAILSNLYISDPAEDVRNEQARGQEQFDVLHCVRPLLELMRTRCMAVYHPRQHISVDERMVGTKARIAFKQYIRDKPTKWGLKFYVLADANGYTLDYRFVFFHSLSVFMYHEFAK